MTQRFGWPPMRRLDTRERDLAGRTVAWMQLAESGE